MEISHFPQQIAVFNVHVCLVKYNKVIPRKSEKSPKQNRMSELHTSAEIKIAKMHDINLFMHNYRIQKIAVF